MNKLVCCLMCLIIIVVMLIQLLNPSLKNNIESFRNKALTKGCDSRIDNNGKFIGWNSETIIDDNVFKGCTSLESIKIPNTVTYIGKYAFSGCTNLKSITFEEKSQLNTIDEGAFKNCTNLESIEIPNSVTTIGGYTFQYCTNLESIEIPNSVTTIGGYAFYACTNLESITFPTNDKFKTINWYTFFRCSNLKSIIIPKTVISINALSFYECKNLELITFEEKSQLNTIGEEVFQGCRKLKSITIPNKVVGIGNRAFYICTSLTSIELPAKLEDRFDYIKPETPLRKKWHKIERGDRILYILKCKKEGYYGDDCNGCCLLEHKADKDESSHCPTNYNVIETQDECAQASKALNPNALDPRKKAKGVWGLMRFKNWSKYCAMKDNKVFYGGAEKLAEKSKNNYKGGFNYICKKDKK